MRLLILFVLAALSRLPAQTMSCERSDTAAEIRAESVAELIPDIVLRCTGTGGAGAQQYQVIVSVNTAFANRDIAPIPRLNWAWNDALLLVDDPAPAAQVACTPADGQASCPERPNANVFQGKRLQPSAIVFQGVRITAPERGQTRTLRITNLRVNAAAIAEAKEPAPVQTSVQVFGADGRALAVSFASRTSATVSKSHRFAVRTSAGLPVSAENPATLITPRALSLQSPTADSVARVNFAELVPNAFRRRNAGTTADDPRFVAAQPLPGAAYNTETGFYNPALPKLNAMNDAGLADAGTRFVVQLEGVPNGTAIWVSVRDVGTTTAPARAFLTYTDATGGGAFNPMSPWVPGWAQLYTENGKATAAWEIVSADPERLEDFSFNVALTALNGNPGLGTVKVRGSLGPGTADALPSFRSTVELGIPLITVASSLELPRLSILSGASFESTSLAPDALMTAFASAIKRSGSAEGGETSIEGTAVEIIDALGRRHRAPVLTLAPGQISFLVPAEVRPGPGVLNVVIDGAVAASESILVDSVAPALFAAAGNGVGSPLGEIIVLGTSDPLLPLAQFDTENGKWNAVPIPVSGGESVYITLLATGVRHRTQLSAVSATIGGKSIPAILASAHPTLPGVDQVTVGPLPKDLPAGPSKVLVRVDGRTSQELTIVVQ